MFAIRHLAAQSLLSSDIVYVFGPRAPDVRILGVRPGRL